MHGVDVVDEHMLGLLSTFIFVFAYLCICVFHIWYTGMSYLISLNPMLFKNIAHVGSFMHFVIVYLWICEFHIWSKCFDCMSAMRELWRASRPAKGIMMVWDARPVGLCSVWIEIVYYSVLFWSYLLNLTMWRYLISSQPRIRTKSNKCLLLHDTLLWCLINIFHSWAHLLKTKLDFHND